MRAARAVPGEGYDDQRGAGRSQILGGETETFGRAGCEVLHEDVGTSHEATDDTASLVRLEVDGDRLLAPVEPDEVRSGAVDDVVVPAGEVTAVDALHLDHPGAEVGEVAGRQRRRH